MPNLPLLALPLLLILAGLVPSALAASPAECQQRYQQCYQGCRTMAFRIGREAFQQCNQDCQQAGRQCLSGPDTRAMAPAAAPAPPQQRAGRTAVEPTATLAAPVVDASQLNEPLSAEAIRQLAEAATAAQGGARGALEALRELEAIPACQRHPGMAMVRNPGACNEQRAAMRQRNAANDTDGRVRPLAPVVRSLELEFDHLPADPVAVVKAVEDLRQKYQPLLYWTPALQRRQAEAMGDDTRALLTRAAALEARLEQTRLDAARHPAARQAMADGRLQTALPAQERAELQADQMSQRIAQPLREAGQGPLFMDRSTDLQQSRREAEQAAQWARWTEPSATEMGLALLRSFAGVGGRLSSPFEAETAPTLGPTVARIVDVRKQGCRKVGDGYHCDLKLWMHGFQRGWSAGMNGGIFVQAFQQGQLDRNGTTISHVFRATPQGWMAPEVGLKPGASGSGGDIFDGVTAGARKAACGSAAGSRGSAAAWARGMNNC